MHRTIAFAIPSILLFTVLCLLPSTAPASGGGSCVELLKSRCLQCHYETRICRKLKNKAGKRAWKGTIGAMIRHGAEVSKEEKGRLATCLADQDREIAEFCARD